MTCVLVAMALFLDNRVRSALVVASFAVLLCWPFCVLLFVPLGVAALLSLGLVSVVAIAIGCVLLFLVIPSAMDSVLYYHKPVFPVANIVLYNAWGDSNADLYGTEPWYFYLTNLLLNFNVVALLALLSLPLWVIAQTCASTAPPPARDTAVPAKRTISGGRALAVVCFAPLYANLVFFSAQPHKEERFLFPLYPIICLAASVSVGSAAQVLQRLVTALGPRRLANSAARTHAVLQGVVVAVVVALSLSRIVAVSTGFSAPLSVFAQLSAHAEHAAAAPPVTQRDSQELPKLVCLGSEWYRFPTSFLLPENHLVGFVDSGFGGLLPQQFGEWPAGTSSAPVGLNGHNLPNPSALRRLSECDYFVDMGSDAWKALNRTMELEEDETSGGNEDDKAAGQSGWDQKPVWAQLECWPFLSVEHSRSPWRSFALPGWAVPQGALTLEPYCIFERRMTSIADD
jgi:alpha-1,2-mannosyltransferase